MPDKQVPTPRIHSFTVSPNRFTAGGEVKLTWDCSGVDGVRIEFLNVSGEPVREPLDLPAHGTETLKLDGSAICALRLDEKNRAEIFVELVSAEVTPVEIAPKAKKVKEEVAAKPPGPDQCPNCRKKAAPFVPPVNNHRFDDYLSQIKEQSGVTDDKKAVALYLQRHGGYIAHCQGCGTDFLVKV